jgi:hypothetical protein
VFYALPSRKKIYGRYEVKFHPFLTSLIGEGKPSVSLFVCFEAMKDAHNPFYRSPRLHNEHQNGGTQQIPSAGVELRTSRLSSVTLCKPHTYTSSSKYYQAVISISVIVSRLSLYLTL